MNNRQINKLLGKLSPFILVFFFFTFLFSRSFLGIYILGYRIGEIAILFSALLFLLIVFLGIKNIKSNIFFGKTKIIFISVFIYFIISVFFNDTSFLNTYTYKASSYIWVLGFLLLGSYSSNIFEKDRSFYLGLQILLIVIYFLSIYGYPNQVISMFNKYSDKFEPHKGSDLVIIFLVINFLLVRHHKFSRFAFETVIFNSSLFLPLFLYKSRAAFIAIIFYLIYELINLRSTINYKINRNIVLIAVLTINLIYSTVVSQKYIITEYIGFEEVESAFKDLYKSRNANQMGDEVPFFFFDKGINAPKRLYSRDGNLNWRMQIWQDVYFDMKNKNIFITGYGYDSIIPAIVEQDDRRGYDGLNENVHNYFVNLIARGGLIHFGLYLFLFWQLVFTNQNKEKRNDMVIIFLVIMFTSFFDSSMENSHFPLIFYYLLGTFYSDSVRK